MINRVFSVAAFLLATALGVEGLVGDLFRRPFLATVQVRHLCFEENIYGCHPDDIPALNANHGGRRNHSLETDSTTGQTFITYQEEVIETNQVNQADAAEHWIWENNVTEDGADYQRYVARFDNITQQFPGQRAWVKARMFVEAGMLPDVYEFLEQNGVPRVLRLYSSRNENLMYSETKFVSVKPLSDLEIYSLSPSEVSVQRANGGVRKLSKYQPQNHLRARRRMATSVSGLVLPPDCRSDPSATVCFTVSSEEDAESKLRMLALSLALKSKVGTVTDASRSADLSAQMSLNSDGSLLSVDGSASGCASPTAFQVGSLPSIEVDVCMAGSINYNPGLEDSNGAGFTAGVTLGNVTTSRLDLLDGTIAVFTSPFENRTLFEALRGIAESRLEFSGIYVDAAVSFATYPGNRDELDDWTTDILLTPAVGVDLWLWKVVGRPSFKVAHVGPARLQEGVDPWAALSVNGTTVDSIGEVTESPATDPPTTASPNEPLTASPSAGLSIAEVPNTLSPTESSSSITSSLTESPSTTSLGAITAVCSNSTQEVGSGYLLVKFHLPEGQISGASVSFEDGERALDRAGVCYRVAWESLEYTCDGIGQWIQSGGLFSTPFDSNSTCEDVNPNIKSIEVMDIAPKVCSDSSIEQEFGPITVSFNITGNDVASFDAGYAYREMAGICYNLTWGDFEFGCQENGDWIQKKGSWNARQSECSVGEGFIFNGDQPNLKVVNDVKIFCPAAMFFWHNEPLHVRVTLPDGRLGGSTIDFSYGSAGRRVGDTCSWMEWISLVFTCDAESLEWVQTKGFVRNLVPKYCDRWEPGYGYVNNADQEYLEVVDTTLLQDCPEMNVSYTSGPLEVQFRLPNSGRGKSVEFKNGQVARGDCHAVNWLDTAFECDPFTGEWTRVAGGDAAIQNFTEGCNQVGTFTINGDQPFLEITDATSESPSVSPTIQPSFSPSTAPTGEPSSSPTSGPTPSPTAAATIVSTTDSSVANVPLLSLQDVTSSPTDSPVMARGDSTPKPTYPKYEEKNTFCGCPLCDMSVWYADADGFGCGERIVWVLNGGTPFMDACRLVGGVQFPGVCGECDPDSCDQTATLAPSQAPSIADNEQPSYKFMATTRTMPPVPKLKPIVESDSEAADDGTDASAVVSGAPQACFGSWVVLSLLALGLGQLL